MAQNIPAVPPVIDSSNVVTSEDNATLDHFIYNPITRQLEADVAIQTTLNSLYLGVQHKMSSGAENIFFTNMGNQTNFYPMWGGLKDQSLVENQGASGFIPPSGRVYTDMFSLPLGGNAVPGTATGYEGDNYFAVSIAGLGITTVAGEAVAADIDLVYKLTVNGRQVYEQRLPRAEGAAGAIAIGDSIEWFFDHPVEIHAGTTIFAKIEKVTRETQIAQGTFQVQAGDDGTGRYWATVHNRLFTDKDLELISPYLKYEAMDFGADSTGSSVLLRDLSRTAPDTVLVHYNINELEAVANGDTIRIKVKNGQKVLVEALPVSGASLDGVLVNSVLNQALLQLNAVFTNTAGFSGGGSSVSTFVLSGNDLTLGLSDGTSFTVDVTTLGVDENKFVSSGALNGSDLVLTMSDASTVTIDATNMVNGSSSSATGADWHISYGTYANQNVNSTTSHLDANRTPPAVGGKAPFYFGTPLTRGTEFRWNNNPNASHLLGIWDGTEAAAGTYNSRVPSNWSTAFNYHVTGFQASSNVSLTNTTATNRYTPSFGAPLALRFLNDGHLVLLDLSGAVEVEIARTNNALVGASFQLQLGCDANFVFPQFVVQDTEQLWEIVHDYNGTESGILNGILDHTILKSDISIGIGEKIMFMLDEPGSGDFFGTGYTNASTGISTAEEQLDNQFIYQTNEALVFTIGGASDWNANTNAPGYFFAASLDQYRDGGGAGTVQGMFSLRFNTDGKLTIYDEDAGVKVATAKMDPTPGSSVHLYYGVQGNRAYYSIPVISKQTIGQGSQPDTNFAPVVADQTVTVTEGTALNFQVISSDNVINQFVETDAPSWMSMNQTTGVLSGTAPAYDAAAAPANVVVVNCKAGNAIGGTVSFTVTVTVAQATYTNTNSLSFNGTSTFLQGDATLMDAMDRSSNLLGTAWSISMWVKTAVNTANQCLFNYGNANDAAGGAITIRKTGTYTLEIQYGTTTNSVIMQTNVFTEGSWDHVLITYDGGTTGVVAADAADYYSRFSVYLNGTAVSTLGITVGNGYDGAISGENVSDNIFRLGRDNNVYNNYFEGVINQVAIWASDEGANAAAIYNSGTLHNLSALTSAPDHYYEIGSSTTTVPDLAGSAGLTGYNFSAAALVTDTP